MKQADWQDVVQNAQLRADTFERKSGIKRRYYERQLGMMKVMALNPNPNPNPNPTPSPNPNPNPYPNRIPHANANPNSITYATNDRKSLRHYG